MYVSAVNRSESVVSKIHNWKESC